MATNKDNVDVAELLVELYSEEIPWRMQEPMARNLEKLLQSELTRALGLEKSNVDSGNNFGEVSLYWTPRRVAVGIRDVAKNSKAWQEERKGPRLSSPQVAIDGFLRSNKSNTIKKRDDYWWVIIEHKAVATSKILGEVVPLVIARMQKGLRVSMRFGKQSFRWVRPLRHVMVIFDGVGVKGAIDLGINLGAGEKLEFTAKTRGHAIAKPEPFMVTGIDDYEKQLRANYVEPNYNIRLNIIGEAVLLEIPEYRKLAEENACLTEYPVVLAGYYDEKFSSLPWFLISTVLGNHQKIIHSPDGDNRNKFYVVANTPHIEDKSIIIKGFERVVRARLADAKFMLERDMKIPIEEYITRLQHITFHPKLGTIADKNQRVKKLIPIIIEEFKKYNDTFDLPEKYNCEWFEKQVDELKADLASETVREFPELQGKIIRKLKSIERSKEPPLPARAIVELADNIDSLVSLWLVGEKATGSGDPFALRRYALTIINHLIMDRRLEKNRFENNKFERHSIPLATIFNQAVDIVTIKKDSQNYFATPSQWIQYFMLTRLRVWEQRNTAVRHDCIEAILGYDRVYECNIRTIHERIAILSQQINNNNPLAEIYHRLAAILASDITAGIPVARLPDESLFQLAEEKNLFARAESIIKVSPSWQKLTFKEKLEKLGSLKDATDAFFDKVMVNVEDRKILHNRVGLLRCIYSAFLKLADFSKIHHKDLQQKTNRKDNSQPKDKVQSHA